MSGPYGYDLEFVLMVGGYFLLFLIVACVVECYLDAKKGR